MQERTREEIGAEIKRLRLQLDISQAELARQINVNPTQLWKYETGRQRPGDEKLLLIAKALGVTPAYIQWGPEAYDATLVAVPEPPFPGWQEFKRSPEYQMLKPWMIENLKRAHMSPFMPEGLRPTFESYRMMALSQLFMEGEAGALPADEEKS